MAEDVESRLKAWEARMAARREAEQTSVAEPTPLLPQNARAIALGAATSILVFPAGFERQYDQHLALTRALKQARVYPPVRAYGLIAPPAGGAAAPRLIVITGSAADVARLPEAFYAPQAEDFIARQCGGDWNAINPAGSIANVGEPGAPVDLRTFDAVVAEIRAGRYTMAVELP
jgi:hypothetical protein